MFYKFGILDNKHFYLAFVKIIPEKFSCKRMKYEQINELDKYNEESTDYSTDQVSYPMDGVEDPLALTDPTQWYEIFCLILSKGH